MNKWITRYMKLATQIASWSKDPSTKVGAVVIAPGNKPVSFGFNGFHRGADDSLTKYQDKEYKHRHIIHAETNAILNAGRSVAGCSIYITHPPCQHCAGTIVQAGIKKVYCTEPDERFAERWKITDTINVLESGGVELHLLPVINGVHN